MSQTRFDTPDDMLLDTEEVDEEKRKARRKKRTAICLALTLTFAAGILTWAGITSFWNPKLPEDNEPQITCQDGDPNAPNIFCTVVRDDPELAAYSSSQQMSSGDKVLTVPAKDVSMHQSQCSGQGEVNTKFPGALNDSATMLQTIQTVLTECEADPGWVLHMDRSAEAQEFDSIHYHIQKHQASSHDPKTPTAIFHEDPTTGKPKQAGAYAMNQAAIQAMGKSNWREMRAACEPMDAMSMTMAQCMKSLGIKVKTVPQVKGGDKGKPPA